MFEVAISIKAVAIFCAQFIAWAGMCGILGLFVYFKDDPAPYSKLQHVIYVTLVAIAFILIFDIVKINWTA